MSNATYYGTHRRYRSIFNAFGANHATYWPCQRIVSLSVAELANEHEGDVRPLFVLLRQPAFVVAVACGVVSYLVMSLIMTATPLSMHVIDGFTLEQTAGVVR